MKNTTKQVGISILLAIFILAGCSAKDEENKTWMFTIEGIALDSLKAHFRGDTIDSVLFFTERKNNGWLINIPDNIYYSYNFLDFKGLIKGQGWVDFIIVEDPKIIKYSSMNIFYLSDKSDIDVHLSYKEGIDQLVLLAYGDADKDFLLSREIYSLYSEMGHKEVSQNDAISHFHKLIKKNPNSRIIANEFPVFMSRVGEMGDVNVKILKELYNDFSPEIQHSEWLKNAKQYLKDKEDYDNREIIYIPQLERQDIKIKEPILKDDGKYKLMIFSASWCAPCHKIIPIYKQIYKDLSESLDMLYVSIDDKNTIVDWDAFMLEKEIPWRSYLTHNYEGNILQKYMFTSIPSSILVHPDLTFEKIDLRDDISRTNLYDLVLKVAQ